MPNISYTKDEDGLSVAVTLTADPQERKGTVEVVQGKGVKISSPDSDVFIFIKGPVKWDILAD